MNDSENIVTIKILDHYYKIKCPPNEAHDLQEAAQHVDDHMRKVRQAGNVTSPDRLAVVTALNISSELMALRKQKKTYIESMNERIIQLQSRIQNFLTAEEEARASSN